MASPCVSRLRAGYMATRVPRASRGTAFGANDSEQGVLTVGTARGVLYRESDARQSVGRLPTHGHQAGREILSLFMRASSVVRFRPRMLAAPRSPLTRQP